MIGGIVNKTREDERKKKIERERKREREEERKRERGEERERERERRERPSVCAFKTPACVRSKRPRVYVHHAHMLKSMCAWCRKLYAQDESTVDLNKTQKFNPFSKEPKELISSIG